MLPLNSCFFIGHREADERLLPLLKEILEKLIVHEQVSHFYVGGYGGFDRMVTSALRSAKQQHPEITLMLIIPYHPAESPRETPRGFDGTFYPDGLEKVPRKYAIVKANEIMAKNSDWLVAYVRHGASNSHRILNIAQKQGTRCINLSEILEGE